MGFLKSQESTQDGPGSIFLSPYPPMWNWTSCHLLWRFSRYIYETTGTKDGHIWESVPDLMDNKNKPKNSIYCRETFEPDLAANFPCITSKQSPHIWMLQNAVKLTMLHSFNSRWSVMDQFSILSTCTVSLLQSQQEISVDLKRCYLPH